MLNNTLSLYTMQPYQEYAETLNQALLPIYLFYSHLFRLVWMLLLLVLVWFRWQMVFLFAIFFDTKMCKEYLQISCYTYPCHAILYDIIRYRFGTIQWSWYVQTTQRNAMHSTSNSPIHHSVFKGNAPAFNSLRIRFLLILFLSLSHSYLSRCILVNGQQRPLIEFVQEGAAEAIRGVGCLALLKMDLKTYVAVAV